VKNFIQFLKEDRDWFTALQSQKFKNSKQAKAWVEKNVPGAQKLDRGISDAVNRRATIYMLSGVVIRISNTKDKAYEKFGHWVKGNGSKNFPKIHYHKTISEGITITVLKRYQSLGTTTDTAKVLRQFTRQLNSNPQVELDWLKKNNPSLRTAMRDVAQWAKSKKLNLDLGNINNYMQDENGTVVIIDPVA